MLLLLISTALTFSSHALEAETNLDKSPTTLAVTYRRLQLS